MTDRTRGYALRLEVAAPPEWLWRHLVEPALLTTWYARTARIDARAGGSYKVYLQPDEEREARIDLYQPPNRLRLLYMPAPEMPALEGVIVDDFIVDSRDGVTRLCLLGSGFPRSFEYVGFFQKTQDRWARALARLKITVEKRYLSAVS